MVTFAHMMMSKYFMDLLEDQKVLILMFEENVQEFSKYMCNIYEMRQFI